MTVSISGESHRSKTPSSFVFPVNSFSNKILRFYDQMKQEKVS